MKEPMVIIKVDTDAQLQRCLSLRRSVFVLEQGVPLELELDDKDAGCTHFLAHDGDVDVGTARLFRGDGTEAKVQRVAVIASHRKSGVGRALMQALEAEARRQGADLIVLSSQVTAIPFYERLGYHAHGDVYDDAGLPHLHMSKAI